jgi:S1-C subfamily serine protease
MKKIILFLIFLIPFCPLYSQDSEIGTKIFETYEDSVVFLTDALFFSSKDVKNPEIFNKIEKKYDFKILNDYFSLKSGTAFFITKDGYLITNNHVVDMQNIDKVKNEIYDDLINKFFSKLVNSVITSDEYGILKTDLKNLIKNSKFEYRALVNNKDNYTVKLLSTSKELDLALLRIDEGNKFKPVPIGDSDVLKVGNSVMAVGYPVPGELFYAVKDFKSSMSLGIVSAIRTDNWGIQHTSSISPGNSGGPLFNKQGEVVGVNVGAVTTGNDLNTVS